MYLVDAKVLFFTGICVNLNNHMAVELESRFVSLLFEPAEHLAPTARGVGPLLSGFVEQRLDRRNVARLDTMLLKQTEEDVLEHCVVCRSFCDCGESQRHTFFSD
jgi:hypothetical protein